MATHTIEHLQEKLQQVRLRLHQAERELNALERQQALSKARGRMQREFERAESKVSKLKEEETHVLQEIENLTRPADASTTSSEEPTA